MRARVLLLLVATASAEQCGGGAVTRELEFGIPLSDWRMANHVCCHNTRGAEPRGYLDSLRLYERLNRMGETTFYDSVCGLPLFVAPRGEPWTASPPSGHQGRRGPLSALRGARALRAGGDIQCGLAKRGRFRAPREKLVRTARPGGH